MGRYQLEPNDARQNALIDALERWQAPTVTEWIGFAPAI